MKNQPERKSRTLSAEEIFKLKERSVSPEAQNPQCLSGNVTNCGLMDLFTPEKQPLGF